MKRTKIPNKILLIRTDRIGDVVLTTPAIRAVRHHFPKSFIAMMIQPYTAGIVKNNPHLNEIIIYDKRGKHKSYLKSFLFSKELRRKGFDLAFIFHPTNRVNIITFLAGIPERIGYNRKCGFLLNEKIVDEKFKGEKHEIDYNLEVISRRGVFTDNKEVEIFITQEEERYCLDFLKERGVDSTSSLIALQPGASCPSKRWPAIRFAEVAKKLRKIYPLDFVIIGSQKEASLLEELNQLLGREAIIAQGLELGNLAAVLKRCSLFISNDTGPVHIASAVKTPSLVIFGRKQPGLSPHRWRPWGSGHIIFHKDVGCKDCLAHNCSKGFRCLLAVGAEEVFQEARKIMERKSD